MKKYYLIFFLLFPFCLLAQDMQKPINFKTGSFYPILNISSGNFRKSDILQGLSGNRYFVVITFDKLPTEESRKVLGSLGIELNEYINAESYYATLPGSFDPVSLNNLHVSGINIIPPAFKIDRPLRNKIIQKQNVHNPIAVFYSPSVTREQAIAELIKEGAVIITSRLDHPGLLFISDPLASITNIASLPFVNYIQEQVMEDHPINYNNNAAHGNDALSYNGSGGRSLNGKGVTVGVGDNSDVSTHIDYYGRLINRNPTVVNAHGTHTTGTVGGAGIINIKNKGMAPASTIISQFFSDIITNAATQYNDFNMNITSNSYHSAAVDCSGEGQYDALSNYVDAQQNSYPQILHIIAAGNDGGYTCTPYPVSFGTVKTGWQSAKNALTIGALDNSTNLIASFSSRGPEMDGRIKPEIVTGGVNILSTFPFNQYGLSSGTSMATPTAAGSLALVTQRYQQLHSGLLPPAALLKALICNTALDLGNPGPDFTYGFGKMNTRMAVESLEANQYYINTISNGGSNDQVINISTGASQLKIMLYWADKKAVVNSVSTLVNDLDLEVTEPNLTIHRPLILNSAPGQVNVNATEGADHVNNIEQVVINNPPVGNYTLNVSGFSIPQGPQDYILTYQVIAPSVTVEYPFGGETLVPGEMENLRWTATDPDTNTFTIEYSSDNGASWTTIDSTVSATARTIAWMVPAVVTNAALIRVHRNTTIYSGKSPFDFVIIGQPVITASLPCPHYAQLDWPAVPGASSYDISELSADTMKLIGNTTTNTFTLSGLNPSGSYWVSVSAKNGSTSGRRSIAVNFTPNTGACTQGIFNNDLSLDSVQQPLTGRQFTTTAPLANLPIQAKIRNLDNSPSTGFFNISYSINGAAPVTETSNIIIPASSSYVYTFAQQPINNSPFTDTIRVWITQPGDLQHANDTAYTIVKLLANPVLSLPFSEGFESASNKEYDQYVRGFDGLDNIDFQSSGSRGRVRSFVNTGFAHTGTRAMTLDQAPISAVSNADSLLLTSNLSGYSLSANQLRLDFYYKNQGQDNLPGNKVWIRGSDTSAWLQAYDLYVNQAAIGMYKLAKGININDILSSATPQQNISSSFQVKFGQEGYTSANTPYPPADEDDGYTFDDIKLSAAINDIGLLSFISPSQAGCSLQPNNPVIIRIKNYNNISLNNVAVSYRVNGGSVITDTLPVLNANEVRDYQFSIPANLSAYSDYSLDAWVKYAGDNYSNNDSIIGFTFHNSPTIVSYPYLERFELSDGNWFTKGNNSSWQWGIPAGSTINKAANGNKAWVTNLTGNYNNNELSYLYSPCFDVSSLVQPELSFSHIFKMEDNCDCDYHWVEYSTDGGVSWLKLGAVGSGTNWYDNSQYQRWQLSNTKWHVSSIDIPTHSSIVRFRFVVSSDAGLNYEGVGVDDINVYDKAGIYSGADVPGITQAVSGNGWVDFSIGNKRIASINPYGQNLGNTKAEVYFNTGPVRINNNQYYLDRNIVLQPTIQPSAYVGVRFYFTDAEAQRLMSANGCGSCTTLHDPYDAGITKYSGNVTDENGTLADDITGFFQFITPANVDIIPYDNGYYAEFGINTFSEFWINNGGASGITPLPVTLLWFDAIKNGNHSDLSWVTSQQFNSGQFIIERSTDGILFSPIGTLNSAAGSFGSGTYNYIDNSPVDGINYYRLKIVEQSQVYHYSQVRHLFYGGNSDELTVYPNPVLNGEITIKTMNPCSAIELFDMTGKLVNTFIGLGIDNHINIGKVPAGVYTLKVFTPGKILINKIVVQ